MVEKVKKNISMFRIQSTVRLGGGVPTMPTRRNWKYQKMQCRVFIENWMNIRGRVGS
jgi:hypothetical protein